MNSETERLREVNAALLSALEALVACIDETRGPNAYAALQEATAAIAKAKGEE